MTAQVSREARPYDIFKAIITAVLVVIIIILLLQGRAAGNRGAAPQPSAAPQAARASEPAVAALPAATASPALVVAPTEEPTTPPTAAPTAVPTAAPTPVPTAVPTAAPTAVPTAAPIKAPAPTVTAAANATPAVRNAGPGQEYIVKDGDWLTRIAVEYLGDMQAYQAIIDATNAKAAVDSSFARITNTNQLEVGQKLWIPAKPVTP
jgi:hypothetical protein